MNKGSQLPPAVDRRIMFLAMSCVGFIASAPATAADAGLDAESGDGSGDAEIIVKGVREAARVGAKDVAAAVDTPRSVVMIDAETIRQTGSASLADALRTVPGITFGAAEGGNPIGDRPFIRGFDSQGSIYVDGVRDLASQTRETFAVDSVQVIRGSDSTLGGRGSAGGTINIISKLPVAEDFENATASFGSADYKRVTADINHRLGEHAAIRIQGLWHDQDVAGRDSIWQKRWGIAPSFTLGLGTPTRLTASYYYLESHELPDSGIPYLYTIGNAPGTGEIHTRPALGRITTISGQTGTVDRSTFYGLKDRDFRDAKIHQASLRVEHDFGGITLRNTARFTHSEQAYSFLLPDDSQGNVYGTNPANPGTAGGLVWRRANTRYGYSESLINQTDLFGKFDTGGIEHSFSVGTELAWEKARRGAFVLATGSTISPRCNPTTIARYYCTSLFTPNPDDPWANYASDVSTVQASIVKGAPNTETQNDASTVSVYGFDSITLLPKLILNLGGRWDRFKSRITPPFTGQSFTLSRKDNLFNWQAGLVFKPTPNSSLYASYATAATPPNTLLGEGREDNALGTVNNPTLVDSLKVQKTRSYEVGAKANLLHERLALSLAAFRTDIDNARVTDGDNNVGFIGRSRIKGVEFSASGTVLPGWTIFGGYTFLDARILDGGFTALTAPAFGAQAAKVVLVPSVNTGKRMVQTARNSFTLWTNVQATSRLSIGGGAAYSSRQYGGYADNRAATQNAAGVVTVTPATKLLFREIPGYWRFDARAAVQLSDAIELSVNAQNLTDKTYFSQVYTNHYSSIAAGRTLFGTVSVKLK
jgi:catecholate siderophore receptor